MYRYSIDGERIEDDEPSAGIDDCKAALDLANAARRCPACGGALKPGWLIHPSCRDAA